MINPRFQTAFGFVGFATQPTRRIAFFMHATIIPSQKNNLTSLSRLVVLVVLSAARRLGHEHQLVDCGGQCVKIIEKAGGLNGYQ